jgi:hypothetical protein
MSLPTGRKTRWGENLTLPFTKTVLTTNVSMSSGALA